MGFHTFDPEMAAGLEDDSRYRFLSRDELLSLLAPHDEMVVADLGSGTGFYADDVAPHVGTLYAVDVQPEMHEFYREKGVPDGVETVHAAVEDLPFADGALDVAYSTMTFHEFAGEESMGEIRRVLRPGGRVVAVDWNADGDGERGPPLSERFGVDDAVRAHREAGLTVEHASSRRETFVCVARR